MKKYEEEVLTLVRGPFNTLMGGVKNHDHR
jgi:hypothetical protein